MALRISSVGSPALNRQELQSIIAIVRKKPSTNLRRVFIDTSNRKIASPHENYIKITRSITEGQLSPLAVSRFYGGGFAGALCNAFCIASISVPKVRQSPLFSASNARR